MSAINLSMKCVVCGNLIREPVFASNSTHSITSLCELVPSAVTVFHCKNCAHTQTPPMEDLTGYYDTHYKILIENEEEDQLYQIINNQKEFRFEHQARTLLNKINLPLNAQVLDYGCAKGSTLRKVKRVRDDLHIHFYDVSEMYIPFWNKVVSESNWSVYQPKKTWMEKFDVVTSFFALEHMVELKQTVQEIKRLLKDGGLFYGIVPNVYTNFADFIVRDHVNHFSDQSLRLLFEDAGFIVQEIDVESHNSALIIVAAKTSRIDTQYTTFKNESITSKVNEIALYWSSFLDRVREFECTNSERLAVIYGSGFYGAYIASALKNMSTIRCFLDRDPFKQGEFFFGKPIVSIEKMPNDIKVIYVGLNPQIARREIGKIPDWQKRDFDYFYP